MPLFGSSYDPNYEYSDQDIHDALEASWHPHEIKVGQIFQNQDKTHDVYFKPVVEAAYLKSNSDYFLRDTIDYFLEKSSSDLKVKPRRVSHIIEVGSHYISIFVEYSNENLDVQKALTDKAKNILSVTGKQPKDLTAEDLLAYPEIKELAKQLYQNFKVIVAESTREQYFNPKNHPIVFNSIMPALKEAFGNDMEPKIRTPFLQTHNSCAIVAIMHTLKFLEKGGLVVFKEAGEEKKKKVEQRINEKRVEHYRRCPNLKQKQNNPALAKQENERREAVREKIKRDERLERERLEEMKLTAELKELKKAAKVEKTDVEKTESTVTITTAATESPAASANVSSVTINSVSASDTSLTPETSATTSASVAEVTVATPIKSTTPQKVQEENTASLVSAVLPTHPEETRIELSSRVVTSVTEVSVPAIVVPPASIVPATEIAVPPAPTVTPESAPEIVEIEPENQETVQAIPAQRQPVQAIENNALPSFDRLKEAARQVKRRAEDLLARSSELSDEVINQQAKQLVVESSRVVDAERRVLNLKESDLSQEYGECKKLILGEFNDTLGDTKDANLTRALQYAEIADYLKEYKGSFFAKRRNSITTPRLANCRTEEAAADTDEGITIRPMFS